jgi:alginate O-acetyltransferase complex protein AlgI
MLFNSFLFWAFFLLVIVLYRSLAGKYKLQNRMLLIASYIFYGTWDWRFLSLILISTLVDFFVVKKLKEKEVIRRRLWLSVSVATNLGLLGFFKYYGFFAGELHSLLGTIGLQVSLPALNIVLPVGISFYTFQTMSYTIDVYRGVTKPIDDILDFALYVSFFPQLVAGPIERSSHLMPQIVNPRPLRFKSEVRQISSPRIA